MDGQNPPISKGRGGRGKSILQALQEQNVQPGPQVPPPPSVQSVGHSSVSSNSGIVLSSRGGAISKFSSDISSGYGTPSDRGAKSEEISSIRSSGGRGVNYAKFIVEQAKKSEAAKQSLSSATTPSDIGSVDTSLSDLSLKESEIEKKQTLYHGESGTRFSAVSNWITLALDSDKAVFEYNVKFFPPIDAKNQRFQLLNSQRERFGNVKSFDGSTLWLPIRLGDKVTKLRALNTTTNEDVEIVITYITKTSMDKSVQLYNVLFGRVMKILKMVLVGRNYFLPAGAVLVPQHKLEVWPGYVVAAHHREGGVMLCCDVSHRVLRTNTVYDALREYARNRNTFDQMAIKCLVGVIVLTRYNNKCYRIDDIDFKQTAKSKFTNSRGESMSYIDYYKRAYNLTIQDPDQCLLIHKMKKRDLKDKDSDGLICLVPELCFLTGLTDEMRSDFKIMKDVAQHTRISPSARQSSLDRFIKNVNGNPEARQILQDWGLVLLDGNIRLEGRVAPVESIEFGKRAIDGTPQADWSRECCRENVIEPIHLHAGRWIIIFANRCANQARSFVSTLKQVTRCMGIEVGEPGYIQLADDRTESYVSKLRSSFNNDLQLAVIVFPTQREDRYSAVKRLACAEFGLPTQCINSRTLDDRKIRSVTQKIALQINCKLGGELWKLKIPMSGLMVIGVDVYHDPVTKGSSVVGFVSSRNRNLTKWFSRVTFQKPGEEIINGLKMSFMEGLRTYHREHGDLPRSVVVYRDGVGDGMIRLTQEHEIPQMSSVFKNFDGYNPKLYYVIVQKRINTRIFAQLNGRGGLDNPRPGSIVDTMITNHNMYDFFLVSQHVRQGTVTPTHYLVAHDGGGLKPDNLQRLTYKLTHLYYNWPGTVRVPAPCQYAHKLAYLVGQNVRKQPHLMLSDKLYFL